MENKSTESVEPVSYIAYESAQARMERVNFRLWIVVIILIILLFGSNAAWLAYESQFEDVSVTQEVSQTTDQGGTNNNILDMGGYDGDAEGETDNQNQTP